MEANISHDYRCFYGLEARSMLELLKTNFPQQSVIIHTHEIQSAIAFEALEEVFGFGQD